MTAGPRLLEICVDEPGSLAAAIDGGADRVELCAALALGGLTPSSASVTAALTAARARSVIVHALVRPRAGDFTYAATEVDQAIEEAKGLLALGVDGLVFGATRDGRLDDVVLARWIAAVRSVEPTVALTLHRAIDTVADPVAAVTDAAVLGFDRVLTSGAARSANQGAATIARMVAAAGGEVKIMAGAGVDAATLPALLSATGVDEVHASAGSPAEPADARVRALGFADPPRRMTDSAVVRALRDVIDRSWRMSP